MREISSRSPKGSSVGEAENGSRAVRRALLALALVAVAISTGDARATPLVGGSADLYFNDALLAPIGWRWTVGMFGLPVVCCPYHVVSPVTGGDVDFAAMTGTIELGGGFEMVTILPTSPDFSQLFLSLVFDLTRGVVTTDAWVWSDGQPAFPPRRGDYFSLSDCRLVVSTDPCRVEGSVVDQANSYGIRFTQAGLDVLISGGGDALARDYAFVAVLHLQAVPEPNTLVLVAAGGVVLLSTTRGRGPGRRR